MPTPAPATGAPSQRTWGAATARPRDGPFAEAYAGQNDRDYDALQRAVDSGRIAAVTGV